MQAFGWAFGATIALGAMGGTLISLGFLRRIEAMNRTTRAIIDGNLSDRVPTRGTGDELDGLAINLNRMLDSVQALMESLGQVSNDIAHDLRTPLTRLRQRLEDIQGRARSIEEYRIAVDEAIGDTDSILGTFAALLRIAQIEAGTRRAAFSSVDLSDLFESIAEAYAAVAEDSGRTLTRHIEPGIEVLGDRELLTQMLANLVENAIRHTPEGTRIELGLRRDAGRPVGTIADSGPGIPPRRETRCSSASTASTPAVRPPAAGSVFPWSQRCPRSTVSRSTFPTTRRASRSRSRSLRNPPGHTAEGDAIAKWRLPAPLSTSSLRSTRSTERSRRMRAPPCRTTPARHGDRSYHHSAGLGTPHRFGFRRVCGQQSGRRCRAR